MRGNHSCPATETFGHYGHIRGTEATIRTLFGRDADVATIRAFLDTLATGPAEVVLEGDVGVGKTALWRSAVADARRLGYRVLLSRATEAEATLAFVALGDLLRDALELGATQLPAPQASALRVALLMQEPDGPPPDPLAVSVATLGLVRALAAQQPVLIALDDFCWLDAASADVLAFVLRRLETERVGVLGTRRREDAVRGRSALLEESMSGRPSDRLDVCPLDRAAIDELLEAETATGVLPPLATEIAETSGGNPLFALEIARGIERGEIVHRPGQPLAVPSSLVDLVMRRIGRLEPDVRDALFVVAAVADPTEELLEAVLPAGKPHDALARAVDGGVIDIQRGRIAFRHPLFASTVYHSVAPDRRRTLHRRIAPAVRDAQERARQFSLGADGPAEPVAAALDEAAAVAAARGAPRVAADFSEQAWTLTPSDRSTSRDRRQAATAAYHMAAGNLPRARALLEHLASSLPAGTARADALRRLATVRYRQDSVAVAAELLTRGLDEAGDDPTLRAGIERDLAWAVITCGDVRDALNHTRAALALVDASEHRALRGELLAADALTSFLLGAGLDRRRMEESLVLDDTDPDVPVEWRPSMMLASMLRWTGDLAASRSRLEVLRQQIADAGDEASLPYLLAQLSETETLAGNSRTGLDLAENADAVALRIGEAPVRATILYARALAAAHLGDSDLARGLALEGLALAHNVGAVLTMLQNQTVLGFLELSLDQPSTAHEWLGPLLRWVEVINVRDPGILRFVPDEAEALIGLGSLDEAEALLATFEADARRLERPAALLGAARVRAMLCSATGDPTAGATQLERALRDWERAVPPFDRARARLVLGAVLRRTRRRRASRAALEDSLRTFTSLGAALWAAKAERMLGGAEETTLDVLQPLTPAERRVAEVVAGGATNRAAADQLFVSVRAVEVHLTSTYRKLGIQSRTELARLLASAEATGPAARFSDPAGTALS